MDKYKILLNLSALVTVVLFTLINYSAFIKIQIKNGFWLFLIFEICAFTLAMIIFFFAFRLDKILESEGYYRLSDEKLMEFKDEKISMDLVMNTRNFLNTTMTKTGKKIKFDRIEAITPAKKID